MIFRGSVSVRQRKCHSQERMFDGFHDIFDKTNDRINVN